MHIKIPHKLTQAEATQKVKDTLAGLKTQFADKVVVNQEKWEGNTLNFDGTIEGQNITGTLVVEASDYVLDAKLPLMLRMFEGRIEKGIAEQVQKLM
jgi:hypothetical protein